MVPQLSFLMPRCYVCTQIPSSNFAQIVVVIVIGVIFSAVRVFGLRLTSGLLALPPRRRQLFSPPLVSKGSRYRCPLPGSQLCREHVRYSNSPVSLSSLFCRKEAFKTESMRLEHTEADRDRHMQRPPDRDTMDLSVGCASDALHSNFRACGLLGVSITKFHARV